MVLVKPMLGRAAKHTRPRRRFPITVGRVKVQQSVMMRTQENGIWNVIIFRAVLRENNCSGLDYI
jgi:hypothetical protein